MFKLIAPQGEIEFVVEREPNQGTPYWTIYNADTKKYYFDDNDRTFANPLVEETLRIWGFVPTDDDLDDEFRWTKTLVKI